MGNRIVILGAGYAGLVCALQTRKYLTASEASITLVNKHNYHQLITLLHETAVGARSDRSLRIPLDKVLADKDVQIQKGTVVKIDPSAKQVALEDGQTISYDLLVVALGSETEYFGIPGLKEHAYTLKSLNQARLLRAHVESCFARYPLERRRELLRFVVGGAGFSGIELVGEFADALPRLASEAGVPLEYVELYNVEAAPGILPGFDADLVKTAEESLKARGVRFLTGVPITQVEPGIVHLKTGDTIEAETIVWTGGVRGNQIVVDAGFETDARGRAKVNAYLESVNYEGVYILGDCALILNEQGRPYPPTAQLAWQMGAACAKYLYHDVRGGVKEEFRPNIAGAIASLGRKDAIGKIGRSFKATGKMAYLFKDASQYRYLSKIGAVFANR
ncbi:NAD(P)/FAD-dependent oxidoreductase [Sulfoacidibacillus thermotolerans]|uniref:FAD/NAD(P)-binding domain-containing protein n=1 Tax=Sulfoacidibacillus thermotolerans TaxID=1765684 RepID=A0A2U3DCD3_SULT2|nr:NAD(P)/FAD-dependent oxidoreductase [Sulfoacidibacillus thermotolerans]PWI58947.1 hypothetical protein BM613_02425 [Sulfoacidibacillus thermotolerans]